jgi:hypothetical protein
MNDFKDVMLISTKFEASNKGDETNIECITRFSMSAELQEQPYEFQHNLLEQIYSAFEELLEQLAYKVMEETGLEEEWEEEWEQGVKAFEEMNAEKRRKMN